MQKKILKIEDEKCPTVYMPVCAKKDEETCYKKCTKDTWSAWTEWTTNPIVSDSKIEVETKNN